MLSSKTLKTESVATEERLCATMGNIMKVERAVPGDSEAITNLITDQTRLMFGDIDVDDLLCKGLLTLVTRNKQGKIVGALSLNCYPNLPTLCSSHWQRWAMNMYRVDGLSPKNAYWTHMAVYEVAYEFSFLKPILMKIFHMYPFYKFLLFLIPPGCSTMASWLAKHTVRIMPCTTGNTKRVMSLRIAHQKDFITNYKMRRAVEEDNDDLVPLIHSHSTRLKECYGEYYISEILKRHNDTNRQIIVAEQQGTAVAVLILNNTVNVKSLNDHFELEPFYGLCLPSEADNVSVYGGVARHAQLRRTSRSAEDGDDLSDDERRRRVHGFDVEDGYSYSSSDSAEANYEAAGIDNTIPDDRRASIEKVMEANYDNMRTESIQTFSKSNSSSSDYSIDIDMDESSTEEDSDDKPKEAPDFSGLYDKDLSLLKHIEGTTAAMIYGHSDYELDKLIQYSNTIKADDEVMEDNSEESLLMPDIMKHNEYFGDSNAFAIELACAWPQNEDALYYLLTTCFECYPSKDMCILSLPSTTKPFPLLQNFVRVTPRVVSNYPQELYIVHKNSVAGYLNIRVAKKFDLLQINSFLSRLKNNAKLLLAYVVEAFKMKHIMYLILSGTDVVGFCILKDEEHIEYLRRCYDLEELTPMNRHKYGCVGQIVQLIISPIFQPQASYLFREIHRMSEYTLLVYKIYYRENKAETEIKPVTVMLSNLIPVKPKKGKQEEKYQNYPEFSLYISTLYLSSMPKVEINDRIAVVGSSIITTSFLENIIFNKSAKHHIIFNNITVLAPHSAVSSKQHSSARDKFFITHSDYAARYLRMINFSTHVNYSAGVMTSIERKNKRIIVHPDFSIPYDILFLLCGTQFPNPVLPKAKPSDPPRENAKNIYIVNTYDEAAMALTKLRKLLKQIDMEDAHVIVYGACLEAFTCVEALLEFGMYGESLYYIEPPEIRKQTYIFPDPDVDEALIDIMKSLGVHVYTGYKFVDCKFAENEPFMTHAMFESNTHHLEVDCLAMFMYEEKCVNTKTFLALNRAGLVFDGRLVIGPDFRTNDEFIYAAGTLTKYSRKYHADHMVQKYFNREEIGEKLAIQTLKMFFPTYGSDSKQLLDIPIACSKVKRDKLMPRLSRPLFLYCSLPGNLHYLQVNKPGVYDPIDTQMTDDSFGEILSTGNCRNLDSQGYFKLHLNQHSIVEMITCVSRSEIDYQRIVSLYGKHERFLNNLVLRCEMVLIADFYDYFNQDWMELLFHTEYKRCETSTMNALIALKDEENRDLIYYVIKQFEKNNWNMLKDTDRKNIKTRYKNANFKTVVEQKILNFIGEYLEDFPMYAHPVMVRMLLQSASNSGLFADV